jgi:hypothetical protein
MEGRQRRVPFSPCIPGQVLTFNGFCIYPSITTDSNGNILFNGGIVTPTPVQ